MPKKTQKKGFGAERRFLSFPSIYNFGIFFSFFIIFFVLGSCLVVKMADFVTLRPVVFRTPPGQGGRLLNVTALLAYLLLAVGCGTIARKTANGLTLSEFSPLSLYVA